MARVGSRSAKKTGIAVLIAAALGIGMLLMLPARNGGPAATKSAPKSPNVAGLPDVPAVAGAPIMGISPAGGTGLKAAAPIGSGPHSRAATGSSLVESPLPVGDDVLPHVLRSFPTFGVYLPATLRLVTAPKVRDSSSFSLALAAGAGAGWLYAVVRTGFGDPDAPVPPINPPAGGGPGLPPGNPGNPANPPAPGNPGNPGNPTTPGTPGSPGGNPGNPDPGNPGNPQNPGNPGTPQNPGTPGNPGGPEGPGGPSGPQDPGEPNGPSGPNGPNEPGGPAGPVDPAGNPDAPRGGPGGDLPPDVPIPVENPDTLPVSTAPEPVSAILLGTGLAAMAAYRRRGRRR